MEGFFMNMGNGYIKLYRSITEKSWWRKQRFTWAQAWIDLLLMANHKDMELIVNFKKYKVPAGSFISSQRKLAKRWRWSISTVNAFFNFLKKTENQIEHKTEHSFTHIYILNWHKYQGKTEHSPNALFKVNKKQKQATPLKSEHQTEHILSSQISEKPNTKPNSSRTLTEHSPNADPKQNKKKGLKNDKNDKNAKEASTKVNRSAEVKTSATFFQRVLPYFVGRYNFYLKTKPPINFGKDGKIVKSKEGLFQDDSWKALIEWFITSEKASKCGRTLSVCFSADTITRWQEQARLKEIQDIDPRSEEEKTADAEFEKLSQEEQERKKRESAALFEKIIREGLEGKGLKNANA